VLEGVVGALSCKLVGRGIPLSDLDNLGVGNGSPKEVVFQKGNVASSELFIARVVRVETHADERTLPLVYHQRTYVTCSTKHQT